MGEKVASKRSAVLSAPGSIGTLSLIAISAYVALWVASPAGPVTPEFPLVLLLAAAAPVLLFRLIDKLRRHEWGADVLAGLSIIACAAQGEFLAGAIIVLMLSGGAWLESHAVNAASSVLRALAARIPARAHRQVDGVLSDIDVGRIEVGDTLFLFPHEVSPADGIVIDGHGSMDESFLTGEPFRMSKVPGAYVLSGAVNGDAALILRATRKPVDSRLARIISVVREAEREPPRVRRLGDRLGAVYGPVALIASVLAWIVTGSAKRFLAVLVVATPCPLILAIPIAVIGSISLCARRGIVVRKPTALEAARSCRTIIFDKTGTLTYGRPSLTEVVTAPGADGDDVLAAAAALERFSRHPLAAAILSAAEGRSRPIPTASLVSETPGAGLSGSVEGRDVRLIGRRQLDAAQSASLPPGEGGLESVVLLDGKFAALLRFRDEPREEGVRFVAHLAPKHRVERCVIVSGDRESETRFLASKVGIDEVYGGKSPEEKLSIVRSFMSRGPTLFIGDGVNDAPALLSATVGVAIGTNSDVAGEAAGVVILDNSLGKVDEFFHISRRMRHIALESAIGGMVLSAVGMAAAAAGLLTPVQGAIVQEIIDLLAIGNALRAAGSPRVLADF